MSDQPPSDEECLDLESGPLDFDAALRCGVRLTLSEWLALTREQQQALTQAADALWLRRVCVAELLSRAGTSDLLSKVDGEAAEDFSLLEATARAGDARKETS